jgi:hypothetical protein
MPRNSSKGDGDVKVVSTGDVVTDLLLDADEDFDIGMEV